MTKKLFLVFFLFGFGSLLAGERIKFTTDSTDLSKKNIVVWESKSLLGKITGTTHLVEGFVILDTSEISRDPQIEFTLDLASFDTGINLRNKHMREKYLETGRFPVTTFLANRVEVQKGNLIPGEIIPGWVIGALLLHGVSKECKIAGEMEMLVENGVAPKWLKITAHFQIRLSDYEIPTPRFLINRMDENVIVQVTLFVKASV